MNESEADDIAAAFGAPRCLVCYRVWPGDGRLASVGICSKECGDVFKEMWGDAVERLATIYKDLDERRAAKRANFG